MNGKVRLFQGAQSPRARKGLSTAALEKQCGLGGLGRVLRTTKAKLLGFWFSDYLDNDFDKPEEPRWHDNLQREWFEVNPRINDSLGV